MKLSKKEILNSSWYVSIHNQYGRQLGKKKLKISYSRKKNGIVADDVSWFLEGDNYIKYVFIWKNNEIMKNLDIDGTHFVLDGNFTIEWSEQGFAVPPYNFD